jgi:hypothetical protein
MVNIFDKIFDKKLIGVFLLLLMAFSLVGSAYAITGTIGSSRMILRDVEVGEVIERNILVRNVNDVAVTIELFSEGEIASWIDIDETEFELAPNQERNAHISIEVREGGVHEGNVNVAFTPVDGGNGVGLTSTIIILSGEGGDPNNGWDPDDGDDDDDDSDDDDDDSDDDDDDDDSDDDDSDSGDNDANIINNINNETNIDNSVNVNLNGNDDSDDDKSSNFGVVPILLLLTAGVFAGFLVVLSIASRKQNAGVVINDMVEVKNDIKKDVGTKPKKSVKKK